MIIKGSKEFNKNIENILIIQLGDIGDVVWATPTFRAVKEAYPQAMVSVLLREGFGSLLEADPHIHKIFEVKKSKGRFYNRIQKQLSLIRSLRKKKFDLAFDLRSDDRGAFMALLSGAPIRASIVYHLIRWRNRFFTHLADPPPVDKAVDTAAEQSLRVVREFGINSSHTVPKLWVSEKVNEKVKQILDKEKITTNRWITLNPFSRWQYKEWGYEKWAQIIDWLWEEYEIAIVIVGASEERKKSINIVNKCYVEVLNLVGKTTLGELAGILSLSYLHIGIDSAAPHIAATFDIPTITIYGPSDWRDWAQHGDIHSIITPDCACVPCQQKGCDGTGKSKCLDELSVDNVKTTIRESLNRIITESFAELPQNV